MNIDYIMFFDGRDRAIRSVSREDILKEHPHDQSVDFILGKYMPVNAQGCCVIYRKPSRAMGTL